MNSPSMAALFLAASSVFAAVALAQPSFEPGDLAVVSRRWGSIYRVRPSQPNATALVSGADLATADRPVRGDGPSLGSPANDHVAITVTHAGDLWAVRAHDNGWGLHSVDSATGDRSLMEGTDGDLWAGGGDLISWNSHSFAVIADDWQSGEQGVGRVLRYSVPSGTTEVVTGLTRGDGITMLRPRSITYLADGRLAVAEFGPGEPGLHVFAIDIASGDRSLLSTLSSDGDARFFVEGGVRSAERLPVTPRGNGPTFSGAGRGLTFHRGKLFALTSVNSPDRFYGSLVEIDPMTGDRTLVLGRGLVDNAPTDVPPAPESTASMPDSPTGLCVLNESTLVFTSVFGGNQIWAFDLDSHQLSVLADLDPLVLEATRPLVRFSGLSATPAPSCASDLDDGYGAGFGDGAVTIDDLLFFLTRFEIGGDAADLDDDGDAASGMPDGAVTIDDLLFFLARFEAGC